MVANEEKGLGKRGQKKELSGALPDAPKEKARGRVKNGRSSKRDKPGKKRRGV